VKAILKNKRSLKYSKRSQKCIQQISESRSFMHINGSMRRGCKIWVLVQIRMIAAED
jgi:hypothetical protein